MVDACKCEFRLECGSNICIPIWILHLYLDYYQMPYLYAICHREYKTIGMHIAVFSFHCDYYITFVISIVQILKKHLFLYLLITKQQIGLVLPPYCVCVLSHLASRNVFNSQEYSWIWCCLLSNRFIILWTTTNYFYMYGNDKS